MSDKPKPPPRRKEKPPIDPSMVKTLIVSGFTLEQISVQMGKAKNYLTQQRHKNPELAAVIDEAKDEAQTAPNYELIETLSGQGCTEEQISAALGYGAQYLTKRKPKDPELAEAFVRGNAKGIAAMTGKLYSEGMSGSLGAIIFYLKNKAGWKDKVDMEAAINNFYMEGRAESQDINTWQQQFTPKLPSQTKQ